MFRIKKKQKYDCEAEIGTKSCSKEFLEDIMRLILPRLCKSDYLSCRVVCHFWRAAIDKAIESKNCLPASRLPWLINLDSLHRLRAKDHCFVNQKLHKSSMGNKLHRLTCFVSFASMKSKAVWGAIFRRKIVGSIEGWLIMVEHKTVYFLNPISGARVMLPSRPAINHIPFSFRRAVASTIPTTLQRCLVASLSRNHRLAFCKPSDKSWTMIEVELEFVDVEAMDERIYAATDLASESLMVFHISYDDGGNPTYTAERLVMNHPRPVRVDEYDDFDPQLITYIGDRRPYLAKDSTSKELFMIYHNIKVTVTPVANLDTDLTTKSCETQGFRVFKLEGNNINGPRWEEVVDLSDRILFLSRVTTKFISSGNGRSCGCSDNKELERNCIYYAFSWPVVNFRYPYQVDTLKSFREFGVYSLTNRSVKKQPHASPKHRARSLRLDFAWFTPNPNLW